NRPDNRMIVKAGIWASAFSSLTGSVVPGGGPSPPAAPANKACLSGVGDWTPTNGAKTIKVVYRGEVEDDGEPGSSDYYRMRMWIPSGSWTLSTLTAATCCTTTAAGAPAPYFDDNGTL